MTRIVCGLLVLTGMVTGVVGCEALMSPFTTSNPLVSLDADDVQMDEEGGQIMVTAGLSGMSLKPVEITLGFGGTAMAGVDYTRSTKVITIPAMEMSGTMRLTALSDTEFDGDRDIVVSIVSVVGGTAADEEPLTVTVMDDDPPDNLTLTLPDESGQGKQVLDATINEPDKETTVTAKLSGPARVDVTVTLAIAGTATRDVDYTISGTTIVIPQGQKEASVTVKILKDVGYDNNETIVVDVESVTNATEVVTDQQGQLVLLTIKDEEPAPIVSLELDKDVMPENGGSATLTATLSKAILVPMTIKFSLEGGSATKDTDYTLSSDDLVVPAGSLTGTLTVTAVDDTIFDGAETVRLSAQAIFNGEPQGPGAFQITFQDDETGPTPEQGVAFLEQNKTEPGVVVLPSGLQYKVVKVGSGQRPTINSTVRAIYTGTLVDGTVFDSSKGQAVSFPVANLIDGWQEALPLMQVGARWMLYLPANLAYGNQQSGPLIAPNSVLIFDIELLGIE